SRRAFLASLHRKVHFFSSDLRQIEFWIQFQRLSNPRSRFMLTFECVIGQPFDHQPEGRRLHKTSLSGQVARHCSKEFAWSQGFRTLRSSQGHARVGLDQAIEFMERFLPLVPLSKNDGAMELDFPFCVETFRRIFDEESIIKL